MSSRLVFWFALTANSLGLLVLLFGKAFDKWNEHKFRSQVDGAGGLNKKIDATERRIARKDKVLAVSAFLLLVSYALATVGLISADQVSSKKEREMSEQYVELEARVKRIEEYLWSPPGDPGGPHLSDKLDNLEKKASDLETGLRTLEVSKADASEVERLLPLIKNLHAEIEELKEEIKKIKRGLGMTMGAGY
jgi:DNA repair exonuclease SbcCD ATPase subunit